MRTVRIYTIGKTQLLAEYRVKKVFEPTFYHKPIETLSAKRCREVLNKIYPNSKVSDCLVVFEWADNGTSWVQEIYRQGTILIG